jgi:hypothetical protein
LGGAWLGFPGDISAAPRSARTFEAIEKFSLKPISWPFQGGQDLKRDKLALDCRVQEVGEGMKDLGFSGLDCLKEKDLLRVGEEIYAIRQYSPLSTSFPLNKVNDELRDLWSPDDNEAIWIFDSFFSYSESDLDDERGDLFEKDGHQGELSEDSGSLSSSDSCFIKDLQIAFSCAIQPFRSRSEGSEFLVARGSTASSS